MEKDREESMRLAESKPGYKFACTVCKKRFHDYANMCRHRRLAHQRHLLISKKVNKICNIDGHVINNRAISDSLMCDLDPNSYFYNNVSRNISENLKYFVEGGKEDLQNNSMYIRWKAEEPDTPPEPITAPTPAAAMAKMPSTKTSKKKKATLDIPYKFEKVEKRQQESDVLTKYNFPPGFKFKENYKLLLKDNSVLGDGKDDKDNHKRTKPLVLPPPPKVGSNHMPNGIYNKPTYSGIRDMIYVPPPGDPTKRTFDTFQISSGTVQQLKGLPKPQQAAYNFSTKAKEPSPPVSAPMNSTVIPSTLSPISNATSLLTGKGAVSPTMATGILASSKVPIKAPSVKICSVCRSIFSNHDMYAKHMFDKHKVTVGLPIAEKVPEPVNEITVQSGFNHIPSVQTMIPQSMANVLRMSSQSAQLANTSSLSTSVIQNGPMVIQAPRMCLDVPAPKPCLNVPKIEPKGPPKPAHSHSSHKSQVPHAIASKTLPSTHQPTHSIIDLSPTSVKAGPSQGFPPPIDLTQSPGSVDLLCHEESPTDSPLPKTKKSSPAAKSRNRVVLQTPKIVPRYESPFHKPGLERGAHGNGLTVPFVPPPVLDLTKGADPAGLGSYQDVDPCLQYGALDYSLKSEPRSATPEKDVHQQATASDTNTRSPGAGNKQQAVVKVPPNWRYQPFTNPSPVGVLQVCSSQVPSPAGNLHT